ncbi:MAG: heme peroxidase family protein [Candidatus Promineifilaceae bacterium]|nr:heme peroxidase family protein [Candidatus Promineifilaceae bacterium]
MPRISHGTSISLETVRANTAAIEALNTALESPIALATPRRLTQFGYLFPDLQAEEHLLPPGAETIANLKRLGASMRDTTPTDGRNSRIPAAYTYLGQFIDHDITLEAISDTFLALDDPTVLSAEQVLQRIENQRTASLDLDSLYEPQAQFDGERMRLGTVSVVGKPVPGKDAHNDLPRSGRDALDPRFDRFALIGDARNDENLNIAQLHLAFLRAHNEIVSAGHNWDQARRILRQLYQWLVVNDFLVRIAGQDIVDRVKGGNQVFDPDASDFFMPLEFSVGVYRFGHSMVRAAYEFNKYLNSTSGAFLPGSLEQLFTYTALSGELGDFDTLPEYCVIEWENFVNPLINPTRRIDTRLVEPLYHLRDLIGHELPGFMASLATRNLLRGYKLRLPTGQAVAAQLNMPALDADDLLAVIMANAQRAGLSAAEQTTLSTAGFETRTPLWFYVLAEAEIQENGMQLGQVGGTLVAEVLIGLVRRSADSIFNLGPDWNPSHLRRAMQRPMNPNYHLMAFLRLAGVHS